MALVGLGHAAALTIAALRRRPDVEIVDAVDPAGIRAFAKPGLATAVHDRVGDLPIAGLDLVVVATPTPTHIDVCRELLQLGTPPPRILCEKPLATDYRAARSLFADADRRGVRLEVLFHYAFSPEVLWTWAQWTEIRDAHGRVATFESQFLDPKSDIDEAARVLDTSWVDSGINALSVLTRFVDLERLLDFDGDTRSGRGEVRFQSDGDAAVGRIETSWTAEQLVKTTRLELSDGAVLTLDHPSQTATLSRHSDRTLFRAPPTQNPGLTRYEAMLDRYLSDDASVFGRILTLRLHGLLAAGGGH